ncbi:MAG: hypothetical protein CMM47_01170 [Rhodospirillaceae bacterium]|nr:hypothetical protein [Rhodospirillaceae bacterium]
MKDLLTALALVLVIEGALYALFPVRMRELLLTMMELPDTLIRRSGLLAAVLGVFLVWLIRG